MLQDRAAMLMGMGIGASLMYLLDPAGGGRRRARVRDQFVHAGHLIGDAAGVTRRDVVNRATGALARIRAARHSEDVDDRVLAERIRSQLGRVVSRPRAIDVGVADGVVTVRGTILQSEVAELCNAIARMSGVREVVDELEAHETADDVPALHGGRELPAMWNRHWSPTAQLVTALAATAGVGLLATAMTKH
jgi:hypothetical protein